MKANKALYKIGDKVVIKREYDLNCGALNYRFTFTRDMLKDFGGKIMTISNVKFSNYEVLRIEDDGFEYTLAEDFAKYYKWASSMFDPEF